MKKEKVSLQLQDDGAVRLLVLKESFSITRADQVTAIAASVKPGVTYAGAIILGIISFVVWFLIL